MLSVERQIWNRYDIRNNHPEWYQDKGNTMKEGYKCSAPEDYCLYENSTLSASITCHPAHCRYCIPKDQHPTYDKNDTSEEHF